MSFKRWLLIGIFVVFIAGGGVTLWVVLGGGLNPDDDTIEWAISELPAVPDSALPENQVETSEEESETQTTDSVPDEPVEEAIQETASESNTPNTESQNETSSDVVSETVEAPELPKEFTLPESATLAFEANGNALGTAEYQYSRLPDGRIQLFSQGEFSFKITLVEISVKYRQQVLWNEDLQPVYYTAEFRGPLSFGNRQTTLTIQQGSATLQDGKDEAVVSMPDGPFGILGMFSTYGFMAQALIQERLDMPLNTIFMGGGRPQEGEEGGNQGGAELQTFLLNVAKLTPMIIKTSNGEFEVERHAIQSADDGEESGDNFQILIYDGRWMGLLGVGNQEEDSMFKVYRTDIFPDGFEIITELRPDQSE